MTTPERSVAEIVKEFDQFINYFGSKDRQAIRPEFQENPQAIKNWLTQTLQAERQRSTKLWDMLDHIDSIPDMMHPNTPEAHEKCWRYMVEVAEKRHSVLKRC